jgi:serine/threonine-protein kinase
VDVYSVGAILYELCTGQRPFDRSDPTATIMAVLLEEPERPCSLNPALPETLELVIQRAMAKSPDARYSSMRALEDDLAPFAESQVRVGGGGASLSVAPPAAPTADRRDGEVAMSRPTILVLGSLGGLFVLFGLMTLAAGTIRLSRGGGATANLTGLESILLVGLLTRALATPAGFVVHLIRKNVWHNSARTIELARSLKRVVLAAFVSYGLLALTIRFVEALVLRRAAGIAWPVWDLVTVLLAAGGATLTHVVLRPQRG